MCLGVFVLRVVVCLCLDCVAAVQIANILGSDLREEQLHRQHALVQFALKNHRRNVAIVTQRDGRMESMFGALFAAKSAIFRVVSSGGRKSVSEIV